MRDGAADFRRVHRIDEPGVAFPVAVAHVVMAGRGREEEALADGRVLVGEGEAEMDAFAARGHALMRASNSRKLFSPSNIPRCKHAWAFGCLQIAIRAVLDVTVAA